MSLPTNEKELLQIEILKQINTNLIADMKCMQTREAMLEYSSNTYKKLFNTGPNPIALIRLSDGHLLEANEGFEDLLGYTNDEFREAGIEYFLMDNLKRIKNIARNALRNGKHFETECKLQSRNHGLVPVVITASLIKHDEQTLVHAAMRLYP